MIKKIKYKESTPKEHVWTNYTKKDKQLLNSLADQYKKFLSSCKTERESITEAIKLAEINGYKPLSYFKNNNITIKKGDKIYVHSMNKTIALFNIGSEDIENGLSLLGAHIDTCRLDLKQNPLYEESGLAYFDTHYYGGIKKYQWVTLPLALHGIVAKKDGSIINITIGEKDTDPVFTITDLLIHLSQEQLEKKASIVIEGEKLDVLIGSTPLKGVKTNAVKNNILNLLLDCYNIEEEDFYSAELSLVPAGKARDLGLDKSMILAYGQDDRVCAFLSLMAMINVNNVNRTACCLLVDKEEIGSVGATGMKSRFFENTLAEILLQMDKYSEITLRRVLANSKMLSSDVSAGFDPLYASAFDKKNVSYLGKGMVFNKFTGARGKSGSNEANAEYIAKLRHILDNRNIRFQLAELGRVDLGGGGTIAYIMSRYGMQVIDSGVAVLSMHAPWEVTSKVDLYETKKGYEAFLREI